ncbi:MAG: hypothetical protein ACOC0P_03470 [Planctomycetota bacterium]
MARVALLMGVALVGVSAVAHGQTSYELIVVESSDPLEPEVGLIDISERGEVVGYQTGIAPDILLAAFASVDSPVTVPLKPFPYQGGGIRPRNATGITNSSFISGNDRRRLWTWTPDGGSQYGGFEINFGVFEISNPNILHQVVLATGPDIDFVPTNLYFWDNGDVTTLDMAEWETVRAGAINNRSEIALSVGSLPSVPRFPAIWRDGVFTLLPSVTPNFSSVYMRDMNDVGLAVGMSSEFGGSATFAIWDTDAETVESLEINPASPPILQSQISINSANEIVGTEASGNVKIPFLIRDGVRYDLQTDLDIVNLDDFTFRYATSINDAGYIVGEGYRSSLSGDRLGFILRPLDALRTTGPVPGLSGEQNVMETINATPGGRVLFLFAPTDDDGFAGQLLRIRPCPALKIEFPNAGPIGWGLATADADGAARLRRAIPADRGGSLYAFTSIDLTTCEQARTIVRYIP